MILNFIIHNIEKNFQMIGIKNIKIWFKIYKIKFYIKIFKNKIIIINNNNNYKIQITIMLIGRI